MEVYQRSGGQLTYHSFVTGLNLPPTPNEGFGGSIRFDSGVLYVAADSGYSPTGIRGGYVLPFEFDGTTWNAQAPIYSPQLQDGAHFGVDFDVQQGEMVVGATGQIEPAPRDGAAFRFEKVAGVWTFIEKLVEPGPGYINFGRHVDLSADSLLITGSPHQATGSVSTVYGYSTNSQLATLVSQVATSLYVGTYMDVQGSHAVVSRSGRIVGLHVDAGLLTEEWSLSDLGGMPPLLGSHGLGSGLALSGEFLIAGAPCHSDPAYNFGTLNVYRIGLRGREFGASSPDDLSPFTLSSDCAVADGTTTFDMGPLKVGTAGLLALSPAPALSTFGCLRLHVDLTSAGLFPFFVSTDSDPYSVNLSVPVQLAGATLFGQAVVLDSQSGCSLRGSNGLEITFGL